MTHPVEPQTRRCRLLNHRWVSMDGLWVCIRQGCAAWYDPHAPRPPLLDAYIDEVYGQWMPPAGPPAPPWDG